MDDVRRQRTFEELKRRIGISPEALLEASLKAVAHAIEEGGMQPRHRAAKLVRCAQIAIESAGGDLDRSLAKLTVRQARALLKRFPGIGDPGADKVLLLCGLAALPALDSNGLRVLVRLGFAHDDKSYARTYRHAVQVLHDQVSDREGLVQAFTLLRAHGRELCKRTAPACPVCPIRESCAYAQSR